MQQCYYSHSISGETLSLLDVYESQGETRLIYSDEDGMEHDVSLEEFDELVSDDVQFD